MSLAHHLLYRVSLVDWLNACLWGPTFIINANETTFYPRKAEWNRLSEFIKKKNVMDSQSLTCSVKSNSLHLWAKLNWTNGNSSKDLSFWWIFWIFYLQNFWNSEILSPNVWVYQNHKIQWLTEIFKNSNVLSFLKFETKKVNLYIKFLKIF